MKMRSLSLLLIIFLVSISTVMAATVAEKQIKKHHNGLECFDCHLETAPTHSLKVTCAPCHDAAEVAKTTEKKYKEYYNPHNPLHYGENALCENCHREHTPSKLECNNPNCHGEFKYIVP